MSRPALVPIHAAACRLYGLTLVLYPPEFRQEYGEHMKQLFRTVSAEAIRAGHLPGLLRFWLQALIDVFLTAGRERAASLTARVVVAVLGALLVAGSTGYLQVRVDADGPTVLLLLSGAFLCGFIAPARAWRWSLVIGLGIPAALLLGPHLSLQSAPGHEIDAPSLIPLLPSFAATYAGVLLASLLPAPPSWRLGKGGR